MMFITLAKQGKYVFSALENNQPIEIEGPFELERDEECDENIAFYDNHYKMMYRTKDQIIVYSQDLSNVPSPAVKKLKLESTLKAEKESEEELLLQARVESSNLLARNKPSKQIQQDEAAFTNSGTTLRSSSRGIAPLEKDSEGRIILPFTLRGVEYLSLGEIHTSSEYHNSRYIFPVGFHSVKSFASIKNKGSRVNYHSEILKGENGPLFVVWAEDDPDVRYSHSNTSGAWLKVVQILRNNKNATISGPEHFGLADPTIRYLIQQLPNASQCSKYQPVSEEFQEALKTQSPNKAKKENSLNLSQDHPTETPISFKTNLTISGSASSADTKGFRKNLKAKKKHSLFLTNTNTNLNSHLNNSFDLNNNNSINNISDMNNNNNLNNNNNINDMNNNLNNNNNSNNIFDLNNENELDIIQRKGTKNTPESFLRMRPTFSLHSRDPKRTWLMQSKQPHKEGEQPNQLQDFEGRRRSKKIIDTLEEGDYMIRDSQFENELDIITMSLSSATLLYDNKTGDFLKEIPLELTGTHEGDETVILDRTLVIRLVSVENKCGLAVYELDRS